MIRDLATPWHLILILIIIVLVFGASKLPELARGTGQALRIFKAETKGLREDEKDGKPTLTAEQITAAPAEDSVAAQQAELDRRQAELDAERAKLNQQS